VWFLSNPSKFYRNETKKSSKWEERKCVITRTAIDTCFMFMTIENEGYDMYLSPQHNFKMANVFETCDSDKKVGKLHRFDPSQQYPNGK